MATAPNTRSTNKRQRSPSIEWWIPSAERTPSSEEHTASTPPHSLILPPLPQPLKPPSPTEAEERTSSAESSVGSPPRSLLLPALRQPLRPPRPIDTVSRPDICDFKLVVVGDVGVGKTSLVLRYVNNDFVDKKIQTTGALYLKRTVSLDYPVNFYIWDTAGQERYRTLAHVFYSGAQAAIVAYDITRPRTFYHVDRWLVEVKTACPNVIIALIGTKFDLASNTMEIVGSDEAQIYAAMNDLFFLETSAKTGMNVCELFLAIAMQLSKDHPLLLQRQGVQNLWERKDVKPKRIVDDIPSGPDL